MTSIFRVFSRKNKHELGRYVQKLHACDYWFSNGLLENFIVKVGQSRPSMFIVEVLQVEKHKQRSNEEQQGNLRYLKTA